MSALVDYQQNTEPTSVITGDANQARYLYYQLKLSMAQAEQIDIIVSFLMESGVKLILGDLKDAVERGARVRILTGNYLGITQPSALYLLKKELDDRVDLRFYRDKNRSFHPKSYIFQNKNGTEVYIGSSNVSRSALTSGIEWNYRLTSDRDESSVRGFCNTFDDLFEHHSIVIDDVELKRYARSWHRPAVSRDFDQMEDGEPRNVIPVYEPRGAQIEALYALRDSREEGAAKGLVHAATGVGKTYLAAFDSKDYERVLFVAHREEILRQAARSFYNVRESRAYGFFDGSHKDTEKSVVFASVSTLGQKKYLNEKYVSRDYFDYIVVDEFHHAVTKYYRNIVDYFEPNFLLGLTATPERMDGRSIYEICDYNVPYEISLKDSINRGMLVPFHYYGVYDDTDYSKLRIIRGRYDEEELNRSYIGNTRRYDLIYKHYQKYGSRRALGFCCSRKHAEDMAREFSERGIRAVCVHSGEDSRYRMERQEAVSKLIKGEISVIFSVDMFNEGVSIDNVDMVLFLRPTESPVVFLQQLGRGLRRSKGKEYLNVLDFIGNYERAGQAKWFLAGEVMGGHGTGTSRKLDYPDNCIVDFDMRLVDLFEEMDRRSMTVADRIDGEFHRVMDQLDKVPTRMELFTYMDDEVYKLCLANASKNPFRKYLKYLKKQGLLTMDEQKVADGIGVDFLEMLETTLMSKVYKMPVLYTFYNGGDIRMEVTDEQLLKVWKDFFNRDGNWKDLGRIESYREYKELSDEWHISKMHNMPLHFLLESGKGFLVESEKGALALRSDLSGVIESEAFRSHMKDVLDYRTINYYRSRYLEKAEGKLLFEKAVDKSLLCDGTTIPKGKTHEMMNALGIRLQPGENATIPIELEGQVYYARLTSLDLKSVGNKKELIQIRYNPSDALCQRINEIFSYSVDHLETKEERIRVLTTDRQSLKLECETKS